MGELKPGLTPNVEVQNRMPVKIRSVYRMGMKNAHHECISTNLYANLLAGPYLTGYLLYLGSNATELGLILSLPLLANAVIVILSAYMMEYYPNRYRLTVILTLINRIFMLSTGLIPFVFPKADWIPVFIVLYCATCLFGSLANVPGTTLLADLVPKRLRAKYFGIRFTLAGASASIILLAIGWVLDRLPQSTGFALLYVCAFMIAVINMVHFFKYPKLPYTPAANGMSLKFFVKPFRDSVFLKAMLFVSFWMMAQGMTSSLFSYAMLNLMKMNYSWMGISNTLLTVVSIGGNFVWGRLNMKWSTRRLLLWVFPLNAVAVLLWGLQAFMADTVMLVIVYTLLGISLSGFGLLVFQFAIGDTPKEDRSMYYAVFVSVTGLFGFFGPLIGGKLFDAIKSWPLWFQEYGLFVCVGIVMLIASLSISFLAFNTKPSITGITNKKGE